MPHLTMSREEFARRAREYYNRFLRDKLEPEHRGKYLALDVETGQYEMDEDEMAAMDRARARMPGKAFFLIRIGHQAAHRLGARSFRIRP
jgi:hypothetical protein